jgi:hypothetical protein
MKQILSAGPALKNLIDEVPQRWPAVKLVLDRITTDNQDQEYQGAILKDLNDSTLDDCQSQVLSDVESLQDRIQFTLFQCLCGTDLFITEGIKD